jgi:hypothetical protein
MEVQQISAIFRSNGFPCELDEEIAEYVSEILGDFALTTQERFDIIFGILESSYGEELHESLSKIIHELMRKLNQKQSQRNMKKNSREKTVLQSITISSPTRPLPPPGPKPDLVLTQNSKRSERLPSSQPYPQSWCPSTTTESPQLRSLRKILDDHGGVADSLDETIAEYLNEICSDEMMSLEELQEIMLTYFPSLDGDIAKAKEIVFALLSNSTQPATSELSSVGQMRREESDSDSNGDDGVESKSNGSSDSEFDDSEDEESELTGIDVCQIQEIFPLVPTLSLQYVFHVKAFDSFTDACQYLLDHQTGQHS